MTTADYLESLQNDMQTLKDNVEAKGVEVSDSDNFTSLANKVANIPSGGGSWSDYFLEKPESGKNKIASWIKEVPEINISNITIATYMFGECQSITTIPLFDTTNVTNMNQMFYQCSSLESIPLLNTANVTTMSSMFRQCSKLTTIPLLNTANVTNMGNMFDNSGIEELPLINTSKVTNMYYMFNGCNKLIELPSINTSKATNMNSMFNYCIKLTTVPVLDFTSATDLQNIFAYCSALTESSLNNIMQSCISALKYTKTKTLKYIGISSTQAQTCMTLSNYEAFVNAGWSTGY